MKDQRLDVGWWAIRLAFFAGPFLAGLDKFFNLLTDWHQYLDPAIAGFLPFSPGVFFAIIGVIEMAVGVLMLTKFVRYAAYIAAVWLLAIIGNLLLMGQHFDVALRDLGLALCAFGLAKLTEFREQRSSRFERGAMAA